jgi:hypothetical protein
MITNSSGEPITSTESMDKIRAKNKDFMSTEADKSVDSFLEGGDVINKSKLKDFVLHGRLEALNQLQFQVLNLLALTKFGKDGDATSKAFIGGVQVAIGKIRILIESHAAAINDVLKDIAQKGDTNA